MIWHGWLTKPQKRCLRNQTKKRRITHCDGQDAWILPTKTIQDGSFPGRCEVHLETKEFLHFSPLRSVGNSRDQAGLPQDMWTCRLGNLGSIAATMTTVNVVYRPNLTKYMPDFIRKMRLDAYSFVLLGSFTPLLVPL
jgi:hypothetical protein